MSNYKPCSNMESAVKFGKRVAVCTALCAIVKITYPKLLVSTYSIIHNIFCQLKLNMIMYLHLFTLLMN